MDTKLVKITGIALVIALIAIVAGLSAFNGAEANGRDIPPGVENVTRMQSTGILESDHKPSEITSEIAFPTVPEKMAVYTVDRTISEKELLQIADNLGVSHVVSKNPSGLIFVGEGDYKISSYKGAIDYSNRTSQPGYSPEYIDSHLPSDKEARKIADEFLDQYTLRPDSAVFYDTTHNVGHFISPEKGVKIKNSESINVWYKHWINDYMILTDKLRVEVDVHGQVRRMFMEWPHYEPYREFPIIGPEEAYGYLEDSPIVIPDGMKNPEKATVTKISLVYIDHTMTEDLDYLIPVYYFQGVVQGDGKEAAFYQCIPATPEFTAEIT
jgi:hypothetical protein